MRIRFANIALLLVLILSPVAIPADEREPSPSRWEITTKKYLLRVIDSRRSRLPLLTDFRKISNQILRMPAPKMWLLHTVIDPIREDQHSPNHFLLNRR